MCAQSQSAPLSFVSALSNSQFAHESLKLLPANFHPKPIIIVVFGAEIFECETTTNEQREKRISFQRPIIRLCKRIIRKSATIYVLLCAFFHFFSSALCVLRKCENSIAITFIMYLVLCTCTMCALCMTLAS